MCGFTNKLNKFESFNLLGSAGQFISTAQVNHIKQRQMTSTKFQSRLIYYKREITHKKEMGIKGQL